MALGLGVGLLVLVLGAIMAVQLNRVQDKAKDFLVDVTSMQLNEVTYQHVREFGANYNSTTREDTAHKCPIDCVVDVVISNRSVRRYHLVPEVGLGVSFFIHDGEVNSIVVQMLSRTSDNDTLVDISEFKETHGAEPFKAAFAYSPRGTPIKTIIKMTPRVTPEQRQKALEIDAGCFSKLLGCSASTDLLPTVTP